MKFYNEKGLALAMPIINEEVEVSTLDLIGEPDEVDLKESVNALVSKNKRNLQFGFIRYSLYKKQGGKNITNTNTRKIKCSNPDCNGVGQTSTLFTKNSNLSKLEFEQSIVVAALLNLYDYVSICSCGHFTYGSFVSVKQHKVNPSRLESKVKNDALLQTTSNEEVAINNKVDNTTTVIIKETNAEHTVEVQPTQSISTSPVSNNTSVNDGTDLTNLSVEELSRLPYKRLATYANGKILNFRRMSKEELCIVIGGSPQEKEALLEAVRLRTKLKYGSGRKMTLKQTSGTPDGFEQLSIFA